MKTIRTPKARRKTPMKRKARDTYQDATGDRVLAAYRKAAKRITEDDQLTATEQSAGFIIPEGSEDGVQVFVRIARFSHGLLKAHPHTGGLLANVDQGRR